MADQPLTVADVRRMLQGKSLNQTQQNPPQPTQTSQGGATPPVTIETVTERPMQTTELVETVDADDCACRPSGLASGRCTCHPAQN